MIGRRPLTVLALACVLAGSGPALAAGATKSRKVGPRLVLDLADSEPSFFPGLARVRLFLTAVTLEGAQIPIAGGDDLLFHIGGKKQRLPYVLSSFAASDAELVAAVVLETSHEYEADLPTLRDSLSRQLREWPRDSRVFLITYGGAVQMEPRPRNVRAVAAEVSGLLTELSPSRPRLIDAVQEAVDAVAKASPEKPGHLVRRVVVVVSDGKDENPEPARYTAVATAARAAGIRIHTVAYSPVDNRRPLLGLGEMSKVSGGTLRWVRSIEGFDAQFRTLATEIADQYVVTLFVAPDLWSSTPIRVSHQDLDSNAVTIPAPACGPHSCDGDQFCAARQCIDRWARTSWLAWALYAAAALLATGLLVWLVGMASGRRQRKRAESRRRAADIMAAQRAQQQAALGHRIVAHGPQGERIAPGAAPAPARAPASGSRAPAGSGRIQGALPGGQVAASASLQRPDAAPRGTLTIVSGPGAGQSLPIRHGFLIGTGPECDLRLPDPAASRYHAQIVLDAAGGAVLTDQSSTNGTFVNGTRVTQIRLGHGAMIRIGSTELRFLIAV